MEKTKTMQSITHSMQSQRKEGWLFTEGKSSISSLGFLNQYHVMTLWHSPAFVCPILLGQGKKKKNSRLASESAMIHLPLSLLIQRGSCLWQKQRQVTGATKINHLPPSTANKCEHLPSHILTCSSVDAFTRSIRFPTLHTNKERTPLLQVEVTADPVWSLKCVPRSDSYGFYLFTNRQKAFLTQVCTTLCGSCCMFVLSSRSSVGEDLFMSNEKEHGGKIFFVPVMGSKISVLHLF